MSMPCPFDLYYTETGLLRSRDLVTKDCTPQQCSACGWNDSVSSARRRRLRCPDKRSDGSRE